MRGKIEQKRKKRTVKQSDRRGWNVELNTVTDAVDPLTQQWMFASSSVTCIGGRGGLVGYKYNSLSRTLFNLAPATRKVTYCLERK